MLAVSNRLFKKADILKVKEDGRIFQANTFGAIVLKKDKKEKSRFGFIVSTKVSKLATQRNRIKRALSEAFRHNLYIIGKGYDILVLSKTKSAKLSTEEIMRDVKTFIKEKKLGK